MVAIASAWCPPGSPIRRGEISLAKTERLLLRAFEMTGYSEETIESFAFQAGPWWPGTKHASAMLVPEHLDGYPRIHVQVRFKRPMRGPMIAGIGRHYGIGLFAESRE
jgi:CRISPR-associated protein Csb2